MKRLLLKREPLQDLTDEDTDFQEAVEKILTNLAKESKIAKALKVNDGWALFGLHPETVISHSSLAVREYKKICISPLGDIHEFLAILQKQLSSLYFQKTDVDLRFSPRELPKRQEILKLFDSSGQENVQK